MHPQTLINLIARIDAMIEYCDYNADNDFWLENYSNGYKDSLKELSEHLQNSIDANVAAMKSTTGE
jgi:hypothetical protein